jgi:hypothetical protein
MKWLINKMATRITAGNMIILHEIFSPIIQRKTPYISWQEKLIRWGQNDKINFIFGDIEYFFFKSSVDQRIR